MGSEIPPPLQGIGENKKPLQSKGVSEHCNSGVTKIRCSSTDLALFPISPDEIALSGRVFISDPLAHHRKR
jgi:hypothetical protein